MVIDLLKLFGCNVSLKFVDVTLKEFNEQNKPNLRFISRQSQMFIKSSFDRIMKNREQQKTEKQCQKTPLGIFLVITSARKSG